MKLLRLAIVVVIVAAFLTGCGKSVVGTYEGKDPSGTMTYSMVVNKDNTGKMTMSTTNPQMRAMMGGKPMEESFKWEQKDKSLIIRPMDPSKVTPGQPSSFTLDITDDKTIVMKPPSGQGPGLTLTKK